MADYSALSATAVRLIKEKGLLVRHVRRTHSGAYIPAQDRYAETVVEREVFAVRTTAGLAENRFWGFSVGSAMLYVAGASLEDIGTGDSFVIGGTSYDVQTVAKTAPAEGVLLWAVELKAQGTPASSSGGSGASSGGAASSGGSGAEAVNG